MGNWSLRWSQAGSQNPDMEIRQADLDERLGYYNGDHLSKYLAKFCYRFNRHFQLGDMIERLAHVALHTPSMRQRLLKLPEIR